MEVYDIANQVKPIRIKFTDKEYVLEFNRKTVIFTNEMGFARTQLHDNLEKMLPILLFGAFQWHHRNEVRTVEKAEEIIANAGGFTDKILDRLIELYNQPINGMILSDEEAEEAAKTRWARWRCNNSYRAATDHNGTVLSAMSIFPFHRHEHDRVLGG